MYDASVTIDSDPHVLLECYVKHTQSIIVVCQIDQSLKCDIHLHTSQVCDEQFHFLPSRSVVIWNICFVSLIGGTERGMSD